MVACVMHLITGASEAFYTLWTRIEAGPSQKQLAHVRLSPAPFDTRVPRVMHLITGASEAFYTLWTRIEAGPSQKQSAHERHSPAPFSQYRYNICWFERTCVLYCNDIRNPT